ncbi:MAG: peptidoglycan-binding protein [Candidatus Magasanikbacteria bacterium]|jgi:hypothetical protein
MKRVFIFCAILLLPVSVYGANNSFPSFPMSFYGTVSADGSSLSSGTKVRAYCNGDIVGETTVAGGGIYGTFDVTGSKLLVKENNCSEIVFKFFDGQTEKTGLEKVSYSGSFSAGMSVSKNLNFKITAEPVINVGQPSSGGGGSSYQPPVVILPIVTTTIKPIIEPIKTTSTVGQVLGVKITRLDELAAKLKQGQSNKEVNELQKELQKLGFFAKNFKTTNYYGPMTAAAVKKYKASIKIVSNVGQVLGVKVTRVDELIAKYKLGQSNKEINEIQNEMQRLGFFRKNFKTTNYYGPMTAAAVKKYQASK